MHCYLIADDEDSNGSEDEPTVKTESLISPAQALNDQDESEWLDSLGFIVYKFE